MICCSHSRFEVKVLGKVYVLIESCQNRMKRFVTHSCCRYTLLQMAKMAYWIAELIHRWRKAFYSSSNNFYQVTKETCIIMLSWFNIVGIYLVKQKTVLVQVNRLVFWKKSTHFAWSMISWVFCSNIFTIFHRSQFLITHGHTSVGWPGKLTFISTVQTLDTV